MIPPVIEKNGGPDWEVDYIWNGETEAETMLVFGFDSAEAARGEADLSLSSSTREFEILGARPYRPTAP